MEDSSSQYDTIRFGCSVFNIYSWEKVKRTVKIKLDTDGGQKYLSLCDVLSIKQCISNFI